MKKSIIMVLSLFCCVICLFIIFFYENILTFSFPSIFLSSKQQYDLEKVASFNDCMIVAYSKDEEILLQPFQNEGEYFLVLPSMAESFRFLNLLDELSIKIDGKLIHSIKDIIDLHDADEVIIEANSGEILHVLKSQKLSAMFIEVEVEQNVLDAVKGQKFAGDCKLIDSNGEIVASESLDYISPRGYTTFGDAKKPYEIEFKSKKSLLNDISAKKWILLANAYDSSLMNNGIVYDFVNSYTENLSTIGEYIDLYINGDYRGNYYLCYRPQAEGYFLESIGLKGYEQVSNTIYSDDKIVYVSNENDTCFGVQDFDKEISGEECVYLVEFTMQKISAEMSGFYTTSGKWARVVLPQNATLSQVEYIKNRFDELEIAANDENGINPNTNVLIQEYLDIESYANRYLIDNVYQNHDSSLASSWFYKKPDSIDKKIYAGPVWDYDFTMHDSWTEFSEWDVSVVGNVYLSEQLLNHSFFVEYLKELYDTTYKPFVKYEMPQKIYELNKQISISRDLNNIRWKKEAYDDETLIDNIIATTTERLDVIESRLLTEDLYCTVTFLDYDKRAYCVMAVKRGEIISDIPRAACYVAIFNGWRSQHDGKKLTSETRIWEDVTYEANWIEVSLLVQNGLNNSSVDVETIDIETLEKIIDDIKQRRGE